MILVIVFLIAIIACFVFLLYNKTEKYRTLYDLEKKEVAQEIVTKIDEGVAKVKKRLTGGAKYGHGSDYDKMHQKRAKGSIRDTGDDH